MPIMPTSTFFLCCEVSGRNHWAPEQRIDDGLIEWRIRCLLQRNVFTYQGSLVSMRFYMIKPVNDSMD
ncbi:MAG: hypothetical protein K0Q73_5736 [Paenibacillus sp.]|jgi:hypothetical protein|nr:hypothetical protein [Paenibacillus sp.]